MLPERVYFDELKNVPEASMPKMIARDFQNAQTHVSVIMRTQGPRETGDSLVMPGAGVGTLELIGKHHRGTLTLGHSALRDGVLLGRYARCDAAGIIDDPSLSRVHALLIDVEDAFLVIDTASRNGTRLRSGRRAGHRARRRHRARPRLANARALALDVVSQRQTWPGPSATVLQAVPVGHILSAPHRISQLLSCGPRAPATP